MADPYVNEKALRGLTNPTVGEAEFSDEPSPPSKLQAAAAVAASVIPQLRMARALRVAMQDRRLNAALAKQPYWKAFGRRGSD